jgi:hypothetical protein
MKKSMTAALAIVALSIPVGALVAAPAEPAATEKGMYGIKISDYKVNTATKKVTLQVKIRGLKMAGMSETNVAGEGHWNIYVNGKKNNFSVNATKGTTKPLKKGDYKVYVELVNNDGTPLNEPTKSKKITVMVD